ncbi:MAG TPA: sigma 54-interacting transcriptional regulator [Polyangiaceae bacterium]|nr:sigma 54-interacting transcriptional regulator [Polyangiaceae bacterium]
MADATTGAMQQFGGAPPSRGQGPAAGLVLLYADEFPALPAAWPFQQARVVIGRDEHADVRLPVKAVSRRHAEIFWSQGRWMIRDLGSTNGTIVDGERVTETELEPMHEVRVGDAILKFVEQDAQNYQRYRLDGSLVPGVGRLAQYQGGAVGGFQIDRICAEVERIAPTSLAVLLLGESGTGKEVVAREIHRLSGRSGAFRALNCGAIPENLIESELFGYKRGAFSGADRDKMGIFKAADGGTLLLDEIGDMPEQAQVKLLRVLQNREVYPVGATAPEHVDVRVVCATHKDLDRLQGEGEFRRDLFGRINEYQVSLPPLRERKEDVYPLVRTFLARHGRPDMVPSFPLMTGLLHYEWPYNVRELEACIKRCIALSDGPILNEQLLPDSVRDAMNDYGATGRKRASLPEPSAPRAALGDPGAAHLRELLERHQGNVAAVGRELGKARMQIHRWMKKHGIDIDDFRS